MKPILPFDGLAWTIAVIATGGVILRPWRMPEAVWAVLGAIALVALGAMPWAAALQAVAKGTDVYLFLAGMMLLAELARREGLFDHVAALAVCYASGSARRACGRRPVELRRGRSAALI